ncbi:MAG: DUF1385 domain-containing protein [Eubacteriales bacterium]|jgi:uncharacterized protein YqhQ
MGSVQYGGQAVIEGVMMRGTGSWAVAVRRPDQSIALDLNPVSSVTKKISILGWPFVRGTIVLFESLIIGLKALNYSAEQATGEEEEIKGWEMGLTMLIAFALAILLFVVLPTGIAHYLVSGVKGNFLQNLIEGAIRFLVFILYVYGVGRLSDIRRVFQYHGAEHKVINTFEAGKELTVDNVLKHSTYHPRCGTSFLLIVLVMSIFLFSLLPGEEFLWRVLSRIVLLPVLAGLSYELLKFSAVYQNFFICRLFIGPGRWLQKLTTGEPDREQVEVAISALQAVLPKEGEISVP